VRSAWRSGPASVPALLPGVIRALFRQKSVPGAEGDYETFVRAGLNPSALRKIKKAHFFEKWG